MLGRCLRKPADDAAVVFVHGLFSSTDTAWRSRTSFWPDLVRDEETLKHLGIYLFDYETTVTSGTYSAGDAADALDAYFDIHDLWQRRFIVFVAHSMGGLIARHLVFSRQQKFIANGIKCGFFLVASPSLGSKYATFVTNVGVINNVQLDGLRFSETNIWLRDLDRNFFNLKEGGIPKIVGRELLEADAIVFKSFLFGSRKVVMPESGHRYFGDPIVIPRSDHFSIAKPANRDSIQHQLLLQFIREHGPSPKSTSPKRIRIERSNLPVTGSVFVGRRAQLQRLSTAWEDRELKVLTIKAIGGTGKTALIKQFIDQLASQNWLGSDGVFCWSFDSQGNSDDRRQIGVSPFYEAAFDFLGYSDAVPISTAKRARLLGDLVADRRLLFVLDGLEPLQFSPIINNGELRDKSIASLLRNLADNNHGLCIVTSRQPVYELRDYRSTTYLLDLNQLDEDDALELLRKHNIKGTDNELLEAAREFGCHALSLNLIAGYLITHLNGDVRLRHEVRLEDLFDDSEVGRRAEFVMEAYARRFEQGKEHHMELPILYLMGLFDRPAPGEAVRKLLAEPCIPGLSDRYLAMSSQQRAQNLRIALERLRSLNLLNPVDPLQKDGLDSHPLIRAYFGRRFRERLGDSWRAAHERLSFYYEEHCVLRPKDPQELEPIYQAISHACKADRANYAYDQFFSKRVRGAVSKGGDRLADHAALVSTYANFFHDLWTQPSDNLDEKKQRSLLGGASFSLKASGHQRRALEPIEVLLERLENDQTKDYAKLAIVARRACEIKMNLGFLKDAEVLARKALRFADRTERRELRLAMRATLGDVLHQLGRLSDAQVQFNAANQVLRRGDSTMRFIEAEPGYKYAEYLLTLAKADHLARLGAQFAEQAAKPKTPVIFKGFSHFVNALALLATDLQNAKLAYYEIEAALDHFERTGATEYVARSLRMGSWALRAVGDYDGAKRDLSEAEYFANTYEYRLIVADCLIERSEFHLAMGEHSEARASVAHAKTLIASMDYRKRISATANLEQRLAAS